MLLFTELENIGMKEVHKRASSVDQIVPGKATRRLQNTALLHDMHYSLVLVLSQKSLLCLNPSQIVEKCPPSAQVLFYVAACKECSTTCPSLSTKCLDQLDLFTPTAPLPPSRPPAAPPGKTLHFCSLPQATLPPNCSRCPKNTISCQPGDGSNRVE